MSIVSIHPSDIDNNRRPFPCIFFGFSLICLLDVPKYGEGVEGAGRNCFRFRRCASSRSFPLDCERNSRNVANWRGAVALPLAASPEVATMPFPFGHAGVRPGQGCVRLRFDGTKFSLCPSPHASREMLQVFRSAHHQAESLVFSPSRHVPRPPCLRESRHRHPQDTRDQQIHETRHSRPSDFATQCRSTSRPTTRNAGA